MSSGHSLDQHLLNSSDVERDVGRKRVAWFYVEEKAENAEGTDFFIAGLFRAQVHAGSMSRTRPQKSVF